MLPHGEGGDDLVGNGHEAVVIGGFAHLLPELFGAFEEGNEEVPVFLHAVDGVALALEDGAVGFAHFVALSLSYLNLSASRCYKIYNLLSGDAKSDFWDLLHVGKADSLGWYKHDSADFESSEVYDFVANVGLYSHKQYEKRKKRGKELDTENLPIDNLNKKIKKAKRKEKISDASHSIFGRKKNKK